MDIKNKLSLLQKLRGYFLHPDERLEHIIIKAYQKNPWFTPGNTRFSLQTVADNYLQAGQLGKWMKEYPEVQHRKGPEKEVGLVMAGNIPLVGFHDLLAVFLSGNKALIKLSSKDPYLIPFILERLTEWDENAAQFFEVVERIRKPDAIIATGSNNTSRYFEYYFGKYPHIIRRNRNSVAILEGDESREDIEVIGEDIFRYFGLGCRNVSKLYFPEGYDPTYFLKSIDSYKWVNEHNKYKNNVDYNRTLLIMNKTPHFANEFLMLVEDEKIASPVAILHYEFYKNKEEVYDKMMQHNDEIQCIVDKTPAPAEHPLKKKAVPPGNAQQPSLTDYADDIDTIEFLLKLKD